MLERALNAEMTTHLGHAPGESVNNDAGNKRNGVGSKTVKGEFGQLEIDDPRDREGTFEPQLVRKHQTRLRGLDARIVALYAKGLSTREIGAHLEEMYGIEASATLISNVTDAVSDEIKAWQSRPLEAIYPILYLDCLHLKIRDEGVVKTKAVYVAIGVNLEGIKDVLGLWIEPRCNWPRVIPCFSYPAAIRRAVYTTNAIESLNFSLRKITKARGSFPSDEAAIKLLYLGLRSITKRWTMPVHDWKAALNQFSILFEDRMPA